MAPVTTQLFNQAVLVDITDASGPLSGLHIGLFTNNILLTDNTVFSDLTEASYNGYHQLGPVTWDAIYERDSDGAFVANSTLFQFQCTDNVKPQTAYGYFLIDLNASSPSNSLLFGAELFATPVDFVDALNSCLISVNYTINGVSAATVIQ